MCSLEMGLHFPTTGKPQHVAEATLSCLEVTEQGPAGAGAEGMSHHQDWHFPGYFPTTGATGNCTGHSRCNSRESVAGSEAGEEEILPC